MAEAEKPGLISSCQPTVSLRQPINGQNSLLDPSLKCLKSKLKERGKIKSTKNKSGSAGFFILPPLQ